MTEAVRAPKPVALAMSLMPGSGKLTAIAHTVAYDATIMNPYQQGRGPTYRARLRPAPPHPGHCRQQEPTVAAHRVRGSSRRRPRPAGLRLLEGQSHTVRAAVTAPVVQAFLAGVIPVEPDRARP